MELSDADIWGAPKPPSQELSDADIWGGLKKPQQEGVIDTFIHGAEVPFKPIVNNALEGLKNSATQTGEAMSEPMNNPAVADWSQHPIMGPMDAAMRALGKAGNALGSPVNATLGAVGGGIGGAVEPALPMIAKGISSVVGGDSSKITPEQYHGVAMQFGNDMANAVALGKSGMQGEEALANRTNPQPITPPVSEEPRQGFFKSNSSDPNAELITPKMPSPNINDMFDKADEYFDAADAGKPVLAAAPIQKGIGNINNALSQSNFDPDFHPQTAKWVSKLQNASTDDNGNPVEMTWTKLNGMRKLLNGIINDSRKSAVDGGGYSEDGYQAIQARNALNATIDNFNPTDVVSGDPNAIALTKQGNTLYKAGMDADTIQRAVDKNMNKAVPSTAIKGALDRIANNKPIMDRFTPEEQEAIQNGAKTGMMDGALKNMSSRLMAGLMGMASGGAAAGPLGVPLGYIAGEIARMPGAAMSTNRAVRGAQKVIDMIGQRPAVQSAMNPPSQTAPSVPQINAPSGFSSAKAVLPSALPLASVATKQNTQPATSGIGQQNMQELQKVKTGTDSQSIPISPQSNNAPNVQSFAKAESGGNPNAKNPNSSASGLYQFTNKTWADMVMRYGKQTGITIADKNNPQAQAVMAKLYAKDNIPVLQKTLGRDPTIPELYQAHVFGAHGASRLLAAPPQQEAITIFPRNVIDANHSIFFNGKTPRTVSQVQQLLSSKVA